MSLPIGFFSPLPLPIMVPFMFMQSAAMALGFGSFFQYGKRKISSMSNDEFNELTPEALTAQLMSSVNNMIPTVEQSFHQMEQMNTMILQAMSKYFDQAIDFLGQWIQGRGEAFVKNIHTEIVEPVQDAFEYTGQDIPSYIQTAGGDLQTSHNTTNQTQTNVTYNSIERYAQKWINPLRRTTNFNTITIKEARYLLGEFSKGNLPNMLFARKPLIKKWESLQPKILTVKEQQIATQNSITQTSTGVVKQIATMYNELTTILSNLSKTMVARSKIVSRPNDFTLINRFNALVYGYQKEFWRKANKYNQFVQLNRKPKLAINSEKSLKQLKMIPK